MQRGLSSLSECFTLLSILQILSLSLPARGEDAWSGLGEFGSMSIPKVFGTDYPDTMLRNNLKLRSNVSEVHHAYLIRRFYFYTTSDRVRKS